MRALIGFLMAFFVLSAQSIVIETYKVNGVDPWDPDSIKQGISGSEEAVIYMAKELAKLGNRVIVVGNPPENSAYSQFGRNPRYVAFGYQEKEPFDVLIAWRSPYAVKKQKQKAKRVYLWPHDVSMGEVPEENILEFQDVLWLSDWQRNQWGEKNPGFLKFQNVFGNGIITEQFQTQTPRKNPYSCIYGSNYGQGLDHLLDIWPEVKKAFPEATLDVYYGWNHWGYLTPREEAKMKEQFEELKALGVTDHGRVGHEELNRAYETASFWTYPLRLHETFCITALRAQLSGAVPVIVDKTALKETVRHGYKTESKDEYLQLLLKALAEAPKITDKERQKMGDFITKEYTWKAIAEKWNVLFKQE